MKLNVKRIKVIGEVGKNDKIVVTGSIPDAKADDITLNFEVASQTGQIYVCKHFGAQYKKWSIAMEV